MKKEKCSKCSKEENLKQGFTLLELLVVVVIIGILASIALPQYRLAVGKSKFATLKNFTKSITSAADRYYLANDAWPTNYKDLDLDFSVRTSSSGSIFYPIAKNISYCDMWYDTNQMAACYMSISKEGIGYYASYKGGRPKYCYAHGTDQSHIVHKICQRDTGKSESQGNCREEYCVYSY